MTKDSGMNQKAEPAGLSRLLIDVGPLIIFFVTNFLAPVPGPLRIFFATGAFMAAMVAAMKSGSERLRPGAPKRMIACGMFMPTLTSAGICGVASATGASCALAGSPPKTRSRRSPSAESRLLSRQRRINAMPPAAPARWSFT